MDRYSSGPSSSSGGGYNRDSTGRDNYGLSSGEMAVAPANSIGVKDIGTTVIAGRGQGTFKQSLQAAIRQGVASVEMALQPEGGEPGVAAESYGHMARRELREIAMVNGVEINSIHSPSQIGNVSGRTQDGYNEMARSQTISEIRKAIDFAADVGTGGSVVVHTGEFDRSIDDFYGEDKLKFRDFAGSEEHNFISWVDAKTGQIQRVPRTHQFVYIERDEEGHAILDETGRVPEARIQRYSYNDLLNLYKNNQEEFNQKFNNYDKVFKVQDAAALNAGQDNSQAPLKALFGLYMSQQLADAQSRKAMYVDGLREAKDSLIKIDEAIKFFEKLPEEDRRNHSVIDRVGARYGVHELIPPDVVDPLSALKKARQQTEWTITGYEDYSISGTLTEKDILEKARNFRTQKEYALDKSVTSMAELGIHAMEKCEDPEFLSRKQRDIYVAPENIFPQMGYGSHPDELIELVNESRRKMVELLTEKKIKEIDPQSGSERLVDNPHYRGYSKKQAEQEAEQHIKATLDFQHLGMWKEHIVPQMKDGRPETIQEREERFKGWYLEQVDKLSKANVLGNLHVVDGMGSGHTHLPVGEGNNPIKESLLKLVAAGYKGVMNSEAHEYNAMFGANEQTFRTWTNLGSPIYSMGAPATQRRNWSEIQNSYFGYTNIPPYSFGSYVPSNDWTLWSQVPLE